MAAPISEGVTPESGELRHNNALDGIRGLAILMVLGKHLITINEGPTSLPYVLARGLHDSLFAGVDIFFALSGFLITRILVNTVDDTHFFRNFYARRSLRIFPLYYAVLLFLFAVTPIFHIHWAGQQWRLLTYSNRLFQSTSGPRWSFYFGDNLSLVNFWSLHIEEQFYFLWPLLVFFIRVPRRLLQTALGISVFCFVLRFVLWAHHVDDAFLYTSLITRLDNLLIGAALALAMMLPLHRAVLHWATPAFLLALCLYSVDFVTPRIQHADSSPLVFTSGFTLTALASAALIAMCLKPRSITATIFRSPFLRFFGKYSYGLYVYHSVLPFFTENALNRMADHIQNKALAHAAQSAISLGLAIAVSMLSFRLLEQPFLKLKRYFPHEPRVTPVAVSA